MFLPTIREEIKQLGWDRPDVVIVTGDTYIDSAYIGAAVIGRVLANAGFRVGIIAQPDVNNPADISRLGEPALFWGVTAGSVDSMVANYTPLKKFRKSDDFTPGGVNSKRPDRASIVYTNLIRRYFRDTKPVVLGGIEASLRRIAHYDYWDDAVRRSLLFDAKADILVYGMGERAILELAKALRSKKDYRDIRGICYIAPESKVGYLVLPTYEEVKTDKHRFIEMFRTFYANNDPLTAKGLCQQHGNRYLIQNPPAEHLSVSELDAVYELGYENTVHPYYTKWSHKGDMERAAPSAGGLTPKGKQGWVTALDTIRFSITSHRGCYGECTFCAIAVHQGRTVLSRSPESIIREAERLVRLPAFKGYIQDVGGPTANMYAIECRRKFTAGACPDKRCLYPQHCNMLRINHKPQIDLLRRLRRIKGLNQVVVGSGIRHDMVMGDKISGMDYLREIIAHHTSGQLKIAPEHTEPQVLARMGKPGKHYLQQFNDAFYRITKSVGKNQFLTYYIIAAHPGCTLADMQELSKFIKRELKTNIEQVQIFTPVPSTWATLMYYTGQDPFASEQIFVEKDIRLKEAQKEVIIQKKNYSPLRSLGEHPRGPAAAGNTNQTGNGMTKGGHLVPPQRETQPNSSRKRFFSPKTVPSRRREFPGGDIGTHGRGWQKVHRKGAPKL